MGNISTWSTTASGNNTGSPPDFPVENQAPSTVNDCARELMAAVARLYNDTNGSLVTTGSSNAYAVATNSSFSSLSDISFLVFRADRANTGAATLAVDGLTAKAIRIGGSDIEAGVLSENAIVAVAYNSNGDAFDLVAPVQNAAQLVGTLADARLSSNVPLKDGDEAITGDWTFNGVATSDWARKSQDNTFEGDITLQENRPSLWMIEEDAASDEGTWRLEAQNDTLALWAYSDDLVSSTRFLLVTRTGTTVDLIDFQNGELRYGGTEVGYRGAPSRSITSDDNTAAPDAGGTIRMTGGSGQTLTLDSDPPDDSLIFLLNTSGNDWTIAASGTLTQAGTGNTGSLTLADDGMATAYHTGSGNWHVSGVGLST